MDESFAALSRTFEQGYNVVTGSPYLDELFKNL